MAMQGRAEPPTPPQMVEWQKYSTKPAARHVPEARHTKQQPTAFKGGQTPEATRGHSLAAEEGHGARAQTQYQGGCEPNHPRQPPLQPRRDKAHLRFQHQQRPQGACAGERWRPNTVKNGHTRDHR